MNPHICQLFNDIKPLGAKTGTFFPAWTKVRAVAGIHAAESANRASILPPSFRALV